MMKAISYRFCAHKLLSAGIMAALSLSLVLTACGPKAPDAKDEKSSTPLDDDKLAGEDKLSDDKLDDLGEDLDDMPGGSKKKSKAPKPQLSTAGKKTGVMVDGVSIDQHNEFLGMTTLKLSKLGVRLESPTITVVMLPGKEAIAYNPQNGNCMALTQRSAAMLAGSTQSSGPSKEVTNKVGTEKIAGKNCIHYKVDKYDLNPETKQEYYRWSTDIWTCNDIGVPPLIVKDCARLTMMPSNLGFPMRIEREARTTKMEQSKGAQKGYRNRRVVDTTACKSSKFDKGDFLPLDGFTTVKDEMQLMMSGDESDVIGSDLDAALDEKPVR